MSVDGGQVSQNQNGWQFQTSPYDLYNQRGPDNMIGVARDGAPIYARYNTPYSSNNDLDSHDGKYGATGDFPEGIYHYVITLNINN